MGNMQGAAAFRKDYKIVQRDSAGKGIEVNIFHQRFPLFMGIHPSFYADLDEIRGSDKNKGNECAADQYCYGQRIFGPL